MSKIKDFFAKKGNQIKELITRFPITLILVAITTLLFIVFNDYRAWTEIFVYRSEFLQNFLRINMIFVLGTLGTFLYELNKETLGNKKYIGSSISFLVAGFICFIDKIIEDKEVLEVFTKLIAIYLIAKICILIYSLIKNSGKTFKEFLIKFTSNIFQILVISLILTIGLFILALSSIALFGEFEKVLIIIYQTIAIALTGLFVVNGVIFSLTNFENEPIKFIKKIMLYAILPLLVIAMIIVYAYIVKIFVISELPRNVLFTLSVGIFAFLYPLGIMLKYFIPKESKRYKLINILLILYIPFIFLEIYSMGVRISNYGITASRYNSIIFIIFQILIVILTLYKEDYLKYLLLLFTIVPVIYLFGPVTAEKASIRSQVKILNEYIEQNKDLEEMEVPDIKRYAGAYRYLSSYGEDELNDLDLTEEQEEDLRANEMYTHCYYNYDYDEELDEEKIKNMENFELYFDSFKDSVDISKYSEIILEENRECIRIGYSKIYNNSNSGIDANDYLNDIKNIIDEFVEENGDKTENKEIVENKLIQRIEKYLIKNPIIIDKNDEYDFLIKNVNIHIDSFSKNDFEVYVFGNFLRK